MSQPVRSRDSVDVIKPVFLLVCLVFLAFSYALPADGGIQYTGTFSSLRYHKEAGDLLGVEIKIVFTRRGYQGAVQIAQGEASELMVVDVAFEKDAVRFGIPTSYAIYGGRIFAGKIDSKGIKGAFRFKDHVGDQHELRRGSSYWDR